MSRVLQPNVIELRVLSVSAALEIVFRKAPLKFSDRNAESLVGDAASTLTCSGETQIDWTDLNEWRARS
jgi:hypothetical protein